jgi:hypothetical protein
MLFLDHPVLDILSSLVGYLLILSILIHIASVTYHACGFDMNTTQETQTNRRWLIVSLLAWGLISALLCVRSYMVWGKIEVWVAVLIAFVLGGPLTFIAVSLPFRIIQNLIRPERRRARIRETVVCILAFLALVNLVYSVIVTYPPDW